MKQKSREGQIPVASGTALYSSKVFLKLCLISPVLNRPNFYCHIFIATLLFSCGRVQSRRAESQLSALRSLL